MPHAGDGRSEPVALIATGRADGFEMLRQHQFPHLEYYVILMVATD